MSAPSQHHASRSLPLLIATLSMMGPLCIDTYLPSFPEMQASFGLADDAPIQQSLTAFLLPFAFMTLWHGALSDALGRKRVILAALSLVSVASFACALTTSVQALWVFRVLQGLGAGVFVIGRAVVRDVYEGSAAQRVIAQVSVLFAIAPAIAPVLGGYLHEWWGWRSVFVFLGLFSALVVAWSALSLPETHPPEARHSLHPGRLVGRYARTLSHFGFLASAMAGALLFMALFLYVASAPALLRGHLHLEATQFYWLFGPVTAGMMLGATLSGRVAGRLSAARTLGCGLAAMAVASLANLLFHALHPAALPWTVLPLFVYGAGVSFTLPTLTLRGLDYFPGHRGLAASCQAFVLTGGNALVAGVLAPYANGSPFTLALVSAGTMVLGAACVPFASRGAVAAET